MYRFCLITAITLLPMFALAKDSPSTAAHDGLRARAEARFNEADGNRDGKLSLAEMQDAQDKKLAERFARLDANKDGGVSPDEMRQAHQQRRENRNARGAGRHALRAKLMALDSNQDQALTRAEIGGRMPKLSENFDRIDGNRDGKITREEMRSAHSPHRAETKPR